jgi:hypothetical protein
MRSTAAAAAGRRSSPLLWNWRIEAPAHAMIDHVPVNFPLQVCKCAAAARVWTLG